MSVELRIGLASCGIAHGARPVHEALEAIVAEAGHGSVRTVGCAGMCHGEPLVEVVGDDGTRVVYTHVTPDLVAGFHARECIVSFTQCQVNLTSR